MIELDSLKASGHGVVTEPKDFREGSGDHRKSVLATTALIIVLLNSTELKPAIFGVSVSPHMLWVFLGLGHLYFFVMWRITAGIEVDSEKRLWNLRGLWKQATARGTAGFPGKTKAQYFLIRTLPIWAFVVGCAGVSYGLYEHWAPV